MAKEVKILDLPEASIENQDYMLFVQPNGTHRKGLVNDITEKAAALVQDTGVIAAAVQEVLAVKEEILEAASGSIILIGSYDASTGIATRAENGTTYTPTSTADVPNGNYFNVVADGTRAIAIPPGGSAPASVLMKVGGSIRSTGTKWNYTPPSDTGYEKVTQLETKAVTNTDASTPLKVQFEDSAGTVAMGLDNNGKIWPPQLTGMADIDNDLYAALYRQISTADASSDLLNLINDNKLTEVTGTDWLSMYFADSTGRVNQAFLANGQVWPYPEITAEVGSSGGGGSETSNYPIYANNEVAFAALGLNKKYKDLDDVVKETYTPYELISVYMANGATPTSNPTRSWLGRQWKLQTPNPAANNSTSDPGNQKPWNCQRVNNSSTGGIFRMEIRRGDVWPTDITNNNQQRGDYKERVEWMPNDNYGAPFGTNVWYRGMFKVEDGQDIIYTNEDYFTSIGQLHHPDFPSGQGHATAGPAIAMDLSGYGTIKIYTRGSATSPVPVGIGGVQRCQVEVKRGVWNWFVLRVIADADGNGSELQFWMNGQEICNLVGTSGSPMPIGFSVTTNAFYPKFGIYRTWLDISTVIWFANYSIISDGSNYLADITQPQSLK